MSHWNTLPFAKLVSSRGSGSRALPKKQWQESGEYPVIGQGADEIEGWTDRQDLLIHPDPALVLYGGHTRRAKFVTEPFVPGPNVKILRPSEEIDAQFLYYFLLQLPIRSKGYADHFPLVRKSAIPFPPVPEQKRIVALLGEMIADIDAAAANAEENFANTRELFESYLESSFNRATAERKKRPLQELIKITHGFAFKGADFEPSGDTDKPIVLTPGNYTEYGQLYFSEKNTKRLAGSPPPGYMFDPGDLTVVMTDLSSKMKILGKPAFIEHANVLHNQRIGRIQVLNDEMHARFLYYFLRTRAVSEAIKVSSTGTMVRHTAPKRILANSIPLPTKAEQQRAVEILDDLAGKTTALTKNYEAKVGALAALREAVLQKAFSGELAVKEAEKEMAAA